MIATIGENMNIRRFEKVTDENGFVVSYIHAGGKIGVLVDAETDSDSDAVKEVLEKRSNADCSFESTVSIIRLMYPMQITKSMRNSSSSCSGEERS